MVALALAWLTLFSPFSLLEVPPSSSDLSRLQAAKNLGLAALEEGKPEEARKHFETVRALAPEEPLGWANGAVAAMRSKDLQGATKLLARALELAPRDARVLALDGTLRELAGDAGGALEAFGRAAEVNPKDLASRWAAARLVEQASASRAAREIEAALKEAPANLFLLARLCEARRGEGNRAAALSACDRMARAIDR